MTWYLSVVYNWLDGQSQVPVACPYAAEIVHTESLGAVLVLTPHLWHPLAGPSQVECAKRLLQAAQPDTPSCKPRQRRTRSLQMLSAPCISDCRAWSAGLSLHECRTDHSLPQTRTVLHQQQCYPAAIHSDQNAACASRARKDARCRSGRARSSSVPVKDARVLRLPSIGARALWAAAVDALGCAARLDRARRGGQSGARLAMKVFDGSQSWVFVRCLRQTHSLCSLPSLHILV